jgi:hypothetical protein
MRDEIKRSADLYGRSLNAEIIQRLKQSQIPWPTDLFTIRLSEEVKDAISTDAYANGKSNEDSAVEILTGHYDSKSYYSSLIDNIYKNSGRIADIEDENSELKANIERDFVLYFNKITQLRQFAIAVIASTIEDVGIKAQAADFISLTDVESSILGERAKGATFWVSRRDLEIENKCDAANDGRGDDDE